jgi:hypothetical protein
MPTAAEFTGADVVWLLTLTWAGRVFRWATSTPDTGPRILTDADGATYAYEGGLRMPAVDRRVSLQSTAVDGLALGFEVLFPSDVDVAELVSRGHDLSTATAEVALHLAGGFYEDRDVVLTGGLRKPAYDVAGEPVRFTVEAEGYDDGALIPAASLRVTLSTWSGRPTVSEGLYYPIVFGTPGAFVTSAGTSTVTSGSPAIVVAVSGANASTLLIAGHKCAATSVRIYDAAGAGENFNTTTTTDDLGQTVTTVDVTGAGTIDRTSDEFWVGWNSGAALVDADGSTVVQSAGALAQWMLDRSTLSVDRGRWAAVGSRLGRYKLAGYIDEPVEPSEWVDDNVLPLIPVTIASGPSGRYPILWRYAASAADAVDHIEHGPGVTRVGGIQYVTLRREVTNEVRFNFAKRAKSGQAYRSVTLLAESGGSSEEFPSRRAVLSRARSGARVVELDSDVVYDQSTALAVCEDILARDAFAQRSVTYRVPNEMGYLDVGDVVTLTDSGRYFTAQVCLVEGTEWDGDVLALDLLIIEQPDRDNR